MGDGYMNAVLEGTSFALFDGAMGTMLVEAGLEAGDLPELLCLEKPELIVSVHRAYVDAGSRFITTNTFGANRRKLAGAAGVAEVYDAAVRCAREAGADMVAADIGPTGALMYPMGDLSFSDACSLFAEQAEAAEKAGADLVIIETMADLLEMTAAVVAVKRNSSLPVFATMTFAEGGRTFIGTTATQAALALSMLGVDALGVNCSVGPRDLQPIVADMLEVATCPVIVQANAGLPVVVGGKTSYSLSPEDYAKAVAVMVEAGATIIGGCCGTNPDYIRAVGETLAGREVHARNVSRAKTAELARCAADEDGRDAEIIASIVSNSNLMNLKDELSDEYDMD